MSRVLTDLTDTVKDAPGPRPNSRSVSHCRRTDHGLFQVVYLSYSYYPLSYPMLENRLDHDQSRKSHLLPNVTTMGGTA